MSNILRCNCQDCRFARIESSVVVVVSANCESFDCESGSVCDKRKFVKPDFFANFKNCDLYLINFTDIPLPAFYELLLDANRELIHDHYAHTGGDPKEGEKMIQQFADLYSEKDTKFRGARVKRFAKGS